jgi:hypothetical protein
MSQDKLREDVKRFDALFEQTVRTNLKFYDKDQIRWITLPERSGSTLQLFSYQEAVSTCIAVDDYADHFNLELGYTIESSATRLGQMCASVYNSLVGVAMRKFGVGVCITELFENNLKAGIVVNPEPSVADPAGTLLGWAFFRFKFAAGTPVVGGV